MLEASNNALAEKVKLNPSSVDIEHVSDTEERYIEMARPSVLLSPYFHRN